MSLRFPEADDPLGIALYVPDQMLGDDYMPDEGDAVQGLCWMQGTLVGEP